MTQPAFFQRYISPDPDALAQKVERDRSELTTTHEDHTRLELMSRIGSNYTNLWREELAAPLLAEALLLARQLHDQRLEVANLISLATARQYLGERSQAVSLFQEALQKIKTYHQPFYEDLALHHLGRCLVEQGRLSEALASFEQALLLRDKKGDQHFIASTRRAIDAVQAML